MNEKEPFPNSPENAPPPPAGAPWDVRLELATWAYFDVEMTGLEPGHDAIVEVAVILERGGRVIDEISRVIAASIPSSAESQRVHGIPPGETGNAPTFAYVAPRLASVFHDAIPVAHGAVLDQRFLREAFAKAGIEPSPVAWTLDTLVLARRAVAARRYSLAALSRSLGLPERRWHRAREDALGVQALFHRLSPAFQARSPRDLWQVRIGQRTPVVVRDSIRDSIAAAERDGEPRAFVLRARGKPEDRVFGVVERWRAPHAWVALSEGGLRVIRADRVLRIESAYAARLSDATTAR